MPLLDHFNPPLYPARHWESFHGQWASAIANALNQGLLPKTYFAEMQVHIGSRVEVDIATLESSEPLRADRDDGGGLATLQPQVWSPPVATMSMPAIFPDSIEALVYDMEAGYTLVGAVELVSPGNKDRIDARRAFAAKCATYLQQGVGVIVVDVVTSRSGSLHNELIELLGIGDQFLISDASLHAVAYRPIRHPQEQRVDVWALPIRVGSTLPLLPLALDKRLVIPLDLEPTYVEACHRSRINAQ